MNDYILLSVKSQLRNQDSHYSLPLAMSIISQAHAPNDHTFFATYSY